MARAKSKKLIFFALSIAIAFDKADQVLLPAVFLDVCNDFEIGPTFLGTITLARGLAQSLVGFIAGPLGDRYNRMRIVGLAIVFWGVATGLVGAAQSPLILLVARSLNGLGLGLAIPVIRSVVSDLFPPHQRGRAFGVLNMSGNLGQLFGGLYATSLAGQHVMGTPGWRIAFYMTAAASIGLGLLVLGCLSELPRPAASTAPLTCRAAWSELVKVLRVRSFRLIIAQGAPGTAPWYTLSFLTMWLQLRGFSHAAAARLRGGFDGGCTLGTFLSGFVADAAASWSPSYGRVGAAQFSVGSGIPLWLIILLVLPVEVGEAGFMAALLLTGSCISWCGGINNTIMADITSPELRATIYGLDCVLEGIIAPMSTALVGALAEYAFGFGADQAGCSKRENESEIESAHIMTSSSSSHDATALGMAMSVLLVVPWVFCFIAYSFLHCNYAHDKAEVDVQRSTFIGPAQPTSVSVGRLNDAKERRSSDAKGIKEIALHDLKAQSSHPSSQNEHGPIIGVRSPLV